MVEEVPMIVVPAGAPAKRCTTRGRSRPHEKWRITVKSRRAFFMNVSPVRGTHCGVPPCRDSFVDYHPVLLETREVEWSGLEWGGVEQGRAGPGRAGQGRAGPGRAGPGRAGPGRAGQGRAGQSRAEQSSVELSS